MLVWIIIVIHTSNMTSNSMELERKKILSSLMNYNIEVIFKKEHVFETWTGTQNW